MEHLVARDQAQLSPVYASAFRGSPAFFRLLENKELTLYRREKKITSMPANHPQSSQELLACAEPFEITPPIHRKHAWARPTHGKLTPRE
jgi:hypothetical protein